MNTFSIFFVSRKLIVEGYLFNQMSHDKIFVSQIVPKFYHQLSKFYYQLIYDVILKWLIKNYELKNLMMFELFS